MHFPAQSADFRQSKVVLIIKTLQAVHLPEMTAATFHCSCLFILFNLELRFTWCGAHKSSSHCRFPLPPFFTSRRLVVFHYVAKLVIIKSEECPAFHTQLFDHYEHTIGVIWNRMPDSGNSCRNGDNRNTGRLYGIPTGIWTSWWWYCIITCALRFHININLVSCDLWSKSLFPGVSEKKVLFFFWFRFLCASLLWLKEIGFTHNSIIVFLTMHGLFKYLCGIIR